MVGRWLMGFVLACGVAEAEKYAPEADAFFRMSRPTTTGGIGDLHIRSLAKEGSDREAVSYVRFNLSGVKKVDGAVFELTTADGHNKRWLRGQVEIYGLLEKSTNTAQDWYEPSFTYWSTGEEIIKSAAEMKESRIKEKRLVFLGILGEGSDQPGRTYSFASPELDEFLKSRLEKGGLATLMVKNRHNTNREIAFCSREHENEAYRPVLELK